MSVKSLRSTVLMASNVPLLNQVTVQGANAYTFGTDLISWDETNVYTMTQVASDFGHPISHGGPEQMRFKCGNSSVGVFDFGLLFSCFVGITTAFAEAGVSLPAAREDTTTPGIDIVWFGNYGIVYSRQHNLIVPLRSSDIQNACRFEAVTASCFTDVRKFAVRREGLNLVLLTEKQEQLCIVRIPLGIQRAYPKLFDDDPTNDYDVDDPSTPWDERSQLGSLITGSINLTDAETMVAKYSENSVLDTVVVREDLMCKPTKRYNSTQELFGSIAYTDKHSIALAVNFRNNLFVYQPWFSVTAGEKGIEVDATPNFSAFFNVTDECKRIARYASTVTAVPLSAAEFDMNVFDRVKDAFYNLELPRIKFASAFGKVVIPEPVLVNSMTSRSGENIYCIVPVGAIGNNLICKDAMGNLVTMEMRETSEGVWDPWGYDTAFYDITGVIS